MTLTYRTYRGIRAEDGIVHAFRARNETQVLRWKACCGARFWISPDRTTAPDESVNCMTCLVYEARQ